MSLPSRPQARGPVQRRRRQHPIEAPLLLEDRALLAPMLTTSVITAKFTQTFPVTPVPANPPVAGSVAVTITNTAKSSAAPLVSVSELTTTKNAFGGDIVRIKAGPGGDFGKGLYAISRGAGENATGKGGPGAINRPGVIYRVDPATGKSSVFFDLNQVIAQLEPGNTAGSSNGAETGLVNWYDMAFDPEGYFDGKPSLFVSSVDRTDPGKNIIYRIAPDGTFMGAFAQFNNSTTPGLPFNRGPSAILVPPPEQQTFLRGLIAGVASPQQFATANVTSATPQFSALFFNANAFSPGQNLADTSTTSPTNPAGVTPTKLDRGPQTGLTSANGDYVSPVYSTFTNFGQESATGLPANPGLSGIQGYNGELLIKQVGGTAPSPIGPGQVVNNVNGLLTVFTQPVTSYTDPAASNPDIVSAIITPFRRFEDVAFDQYGYFSYQTPNPFTGSVTPTFKGSLFAADLASGATVQVPVKNGAGQTVNVTVPIQGLGGVAVLPADTTGTNFVPAFDPATGNTTASTNALTDNFGGRIVQIDPNGNVTNFATGFHTSARQDAQSFIDSSLSLTFSADGTTMWVADDDGIWQFKSVTSLANSATGQQIGLSDLRSLGVPYQGQDSAVAIVDTGVDAASTPFRGRVSQGANVFGNIKSNTSLGNDDTAPNANGHGTLIAGVVAQFVPQATIEPVNVFYPGVGATTTTGGTGGTGGGGAATTTASINPTSNQSVYQGFGYVADHPFVKDPIRPNKTDRVIAADFGFGTNATFPTEGEAFKKYPQVIIAFKNQMKRFRDLGIAPVAAAGQFGVGSGTTTTTATTPTSGDLKGMSLPALLNEVISVTGTYPFPFSLNAASTPNDPTPGVFPRRSGPILITGSAGSGSTTGGASLSTPFGPANSSLATLTTPDVSVFSDKLLNAANRSYTTDFAAPALDVPTFTRTSTTAPTTSSGIGGGVTTSTVIGGHLSFTESGTSLSSGIVTGSFATVASAIDYWTGISKAGATVDAYLTQPVGVNVLNFTPNTGQNNNDSNVLKDLSAYANPDAINAILQWTAVPVADAPNPAESAVNQPALIGSANYRNYSRVDVGNAIAAIEGSIALDYLIKRGDFDIIDSDHTGLITAQKLQTFEDQAATIGRATDGAMARFLGGNAKPVAGPEGQNINSGFTTNAGTNLEQPDAPDVLQRRFNFFDYAIDGQLNGAISIDQYKALAAKLLPAPDSFVVVDRQRASANGYLIDPSHNRDYVDLQHLLPQYAFVPKAAVARYAHISPAKFHVNFRKNPALDAPHYALFESQASANKPTAKPASTTLQPLVTSTAPVTKSSDPTKATTQSAKGTAQPQNPAVSYLKNLLYKTTGKKL